MNERIRELAEQCFSFKYKTAPNELNPGHHMDHIHMFAELIVKECAGACLHDDWEDPRWGRFYANKIREHFGIE